MPGLIDCHIHAPQMPNIGLGLDMELLDWLNAYTFPMEAQFADATFAAHVYERVVRRTLAAGTTLAAYFATNHRGSSVLLAREAIRHGQRAFVGKVSSNCCSPADYVETTDGSLADNRAFVDEVLAFRSHLVQPIVTPRFALSCDMPLMKALGALARERGLSVQSHISESVGEIRLVNSTYGMSYAQVYDTADLLTDKTVLAHGVHLSDEELRLLAERGTSIAHCPNSNTNLRSGLCDVRRLWAAGIAVGLGTDVSGGSKASVLAAIKDALDVSLHLEFVKKQHIVGTGQMRPIDSAYVPLTYKEGIYLATLGGAKALNVEETVGNFEVGKEFDALLVDVDAGAIDRFEGSKLEAKKTDEGRLLELVQRFVYVGDDRNVKQVFVQGRQVKV